MPTGPELEFQFSQDDGDGEQIWNINIGPVLSAAAPFRPPLTRLVCGAPQSGTHLFMVGGTLVEKKACRAEQFALGDELG